MIDVQTALQNILDAIYGEEVRTSIHDAIYIMSQICDMKFGSGAPVGDYEDNTVYVDENTFDLYKLENGEWVLKGNFEGNAIRNISKTSTQGLTDTYTIEFSKTPSVTFEVNNGNGISDIEKTSTSGLVDTYTISYTDGTTTEFEITNGNGITDISKTSTSVLTDTYTITYSDGTSTEFKVTNGNGIASISKTGTSENVDTYTILFTDESNATFDITNGIDGTNGVDGIGVTSIAETSYVGREHIITITLSNGNTETFKIYDGQSGSGTGDMTKTVYDTDNDGIVDSAEELHNAKNNDALKEIDEDANGNMTYKGKPIASGGSILHIYTTDFIGQTVTIHNSDPYTGEVEEIEGEFGDNGLCTVNITKTGTVTATVEDGAENYTASTNAPYYGIFKIVLNRGEAAGVTINIDNDDLFQSAVITCVNETDNTRTQTALVSKALRTASFTIPTGDTYHIEYGSADYYSKPANTASKVAVMSSTVEYTGNYQFLMEKVTVNVSADTAIDVSNKNISLVNVTDSSKNDTKPAIDGTVVFYVLENEEYYVEAEEVDLQSKPTSEHFTAVRNTERNINLMYEYIMGQAEVTLTADTAISVENRVITLHDITAGITKDGVTDSNGIATINVEQNHEYYVTAEEIPLNYAAPSNHYTAVKGQTQEISLRYEYVMESCEVTVTKNGGSLNVDGITVRLFNSDGVEQEHKITADGGKTSFNIMQGEQYYVKADDKDFYLTEKSSTFTAVRGNTNAVTLEYDYNAEDVTVTLSADTSLDVTSKNVTLHDVTSTTTLVKQAVNGTADFKILAGHTYYLTAEDVESYIINPSENYVAVKAGTRNIALLYELYTATIAVTYPSGSVCTCSKGSTSYTAADTSGSYTFSVHEAGEWAISISNGSQTASKTVTITNHGDAETVTLAYFSATIITTYPTGATCTCSKDSTVLTAAQSPYAFSVAETGIWTISITDGTHTRTKDVEITADGQTETVTMAFTTIYGVQWDGTSTTSWTRTDASAAFIDPVPYYSGMSGTPSSPFDELMPWSGMVESDRTGGKMVAIPKFWYKLEKSGNGLKIQIADGEVDGFKVSPAHIDRGDGAGERDVVYVGKYHCAASDYKSKTGENPKVNITRSAARSSIHNLGTDIWQWDWLTRFTLFLLYLVEFADWNTQAKIGGGCSGTTSSSSAVFNMGKSDTISYHTGTVSNSHSAYGVCKYRNIEGLWDNCYDWVDGVYYNSNGMNIIKKPSDFSDSSNGTLIGKPTRGYPSVFTVSENVTDVPLFYPSTSSGSDSTYSCDSWGFHTSSPCLYVGGSYYQHLDRGLFFVNYNGTSYSYGHIGSRLLELPS